MCDDVIIQAMHRTTFEQLVETVLRNLPHTIQTRIANVAIVVEDLPDRATLERAGVDDPFDLLGFYEGIPLTERTSSYGMIVPDVIHLYQKPIEAVCATDAEVREEIRRTVLHEIAHYFGIDEDGLAGTRVE